MATQRRADTQRVTHSFTMTQLDADHARLECTPCGYRTSDIEWENWPDKHPACQPPSHGGRP